MRKLLRLGAIAAAIAVAASAVLTVVGSGPALATNAPGDVFTLSNEAAGNRVLALNVGPYGGLRQIGSIETGGRGSGSGLGSQGALVSDGRYIFAVNAGSNDISSIAITRDGLKLKDVEPSGGERPISITAHDGLVYVLNAGGAGNIQGFRVADNGDLRSIEGSTRPLSSGASSPAQIAFSPNGRLLVVTERATNLISTYLVGPRGRAFGPNAQPSAGATPFGFAFDKRGDLIVSEAFGGAPDASAVSSYDVNRLGQLSVITPSALTTETAACWIAITPNGRFAYATNTGSGTVTGYAIGLDGSLTLLNADGVTGVTGAGSGPVDASTSGNGRHLFILNGASDSITAFRITRDGGLIQTDNLVGLPASTTGLAVR